MDNLFGMNNAIRGTAYGAAFLILAATLIVSAQQPDPDKEILNRLYEEIIGSSPAGAGISTDSTRPVPEKTTGDPISSTESANGAAERLDVEIVKMIRDAQVRHSDAVKFMLDGR